MISAIIFTAFGPLVGNRCYPNTFPEPDNNRPRVWPAIRFIIVSRTPIEDICGTNDGDTDDSRVQLDIVAQTYGAMVTLRDQCADIANGLVSVIPVVRGQEFETFDTETKTHRTVMELLFTPSTASGSP
jgi:hypothetical protein